MIAKMQDRGRGVINLHIDARNVQQYSNKNVSAVGLDLDSAEIQRDLDRDLWHGGSEIVDPELCGWLTIKEPKLKLNENATVLPMLPTGRKSLRPQTKQTGGAVETGPLYDPAA